MYALSADIERIHSDLRDTQKALLSTSNLSNTTVKRLDQIELELQSVLEATTRNVKLINTLSSDVDVSGLKENRSNTLSLLLSDLDTMNLHINGINKELLSIKTTRSLRYLPLTVKAINGHHREIVRIWETLF